jgi:hypothetical protein
MKVTGHIHIKGRGDAVTIDALPEGLVEGMFVRRVAPGLRGGIIEPAWRVVGIGTLALPRSHTNGKPADLLLRGKLPLPAVGTEIEVVPEAEWVARNFILDRPDGLRLSVSLGDRDGGFGVPTWCWFVYDLTQRPPWPRVLWGTSETSETAKIAAIDGAKRVGEKRWGTMRGAGPE